MSGDNFTLCFNAMKEEIKSLAKVCLLTKGSCSYKLQMGLQNLKGCSMGNVKRYKGRLEANDLTQRRGIDYHGMNGSF
jgi:hypothetical protein